MTKKSDGDAVRDFTRALLTARPSIKPSQFEGRKYRTSLWNRPFASNALGVNPDQIPEARAALRARGCTADFDSEGRCIVTSEKQFREVAKASGLWNGRDGFAVKGESDQRILTGRDREYARRELKAQLLRECQY